MRHFAGHDGSIKEFTDSCPILRGRGPLSPTAYAFATLNGVNDRLDWVSGGTSKIGRM